VSGQLGVLSHQALHLLAQPLALAISTAAAHRSSSSHSPD
jgi:hypothetical protein